MIFVRKTRWAITILIHSCSFMRHEMCVTQTWNTVARKQMPERWIGENGWEKIWIYIVKETTKECILCGSYDGRQASFSAGLYYSLLKRNSVTESPKYQVAQIAFSVRWDLAHDAYRVSNSVESEDDFSISFLHG